MDDKSRRQRIVEATRERVARSRARLKEAQQLLEMSHALIVDADEHIRHSRRQVAASKPSSLEDERPQE